MNDYTIAKKAYYILDRSIAISGKTKKEIAAAIYPGRKPETAKSLLSRAMSSENMDVHLSIENILIIIKETRPDDFLYFLCDEFGFERPSKKTPDKIKQYIAKELRDINYKLTALLRQLPDIDKKNKD